MWWGSGGLYVNNAHAEDQGGNTPYFAFVAETQSAIRKESHFVSGTLLHSIKP